MELINGRLRVRRMRKKRKEHRKEKKNYQETQLRLEKKSGAGERQNTAERE